MEHNVLLQMISLSDLIQTFISAICKLAIAVITVVRMSWLTSFSTEEWKAC